MLVVRTGAVARAQVDDVRLTLRPVVSSACVFSTSLDTKKRDINEWKSENRIFEIRLKVHISKHFYQMTMLHILENCMMIGKKCGINGDISHSPLSIKPMDALSVNVYDCKGFIILQRVEFPPLFWKASLRWFAAFDHHPLVCVFDLPLVPLTPRYFNFSFPTGGSLCLCDLFRISFSSPLTPNFSCAHHQCFWEL